VEGLISSVRNFNPVWVCKYKVFYFKKMNIINKFYVIKILSESQIGLDYFVFLTHFM
jgi:hypothetical protein